jgi:hypothetical protein
MYIELFMAVFLVSNLPYLFKKPADYNQNLQPNWSIIVVGALAGLISGLTGAVGVLFNRVYFRCGLSREEIVATRAANEVSLHFIKLVLYAWLGLFTFNVFIFGSLIALAAIIATFFMKKILAKISITVFSKIGYGAMVIAGVLMLNSAVMRIHATHEPSMKIMHTAKGHDAEFSWNDLPYIIEFKYGEGFEFEKTIPLSSLSAEKQKIVSQHRGQASKVVIEKVYAIDKISYEANYFNDKDELVNKIKFN